MISGGHGRWPLAAALALSACALCALQASGQEQAAELPAEDVAAGLAAWRSLESVLTHPRCLNCHTVTDYPTQRDERRPHAPQVRRGADGHGEGPKCQACHTGANQGAGIPGAQDWHMPPLTLAWESEPGKPASGAAICASLKHGEEGEVEPDYERLIEYAQFAGFVRWAWEPGRLMGGAPRSTPLLSHEEFVAALKRWISAGAPCPSERD